MRDRHRRTGDRHQNNDLKSIGCSLIDKVIHLLNTCCLTIKQGAEYATGVIVYEEVTRSAAT